MVSVIQRGSPENRIFSQLSITVSQAAMMNTD